MTVAVAERTRRRHLRALVVACSVVAALAVAAWRIGPRLPHAVHQLGSLPAPNWPWVAAAASLIAISYVFSALALSVAAGRRLPLARTVLVQLAAAVANRVTPASAGGAAINARYLNRQGLSAGESGAVVALSGVAHAIVAIGCVIVLGPSVAVSIGGHVLDAISGEDAVWPALALIAAALAVSIGVRTVVRKCPAWATRVRQPVDDALRLARGLVRSPLRSALMILLAVALKAANLLALLAALWAFDGQVATWHVAVVYLVGATTAGLVPTPAGLGTVDAALIGGLVGAGATAGATLAAVAVYRLLTFWAPIGPGLIASSMLRRRMAI